MNDQLFVILILVCVQIAGAHTIEQNDITRLVICLINASLLSVWLAPSGESTGIGLALVIAVLYGMLSPMIQEGVSYAKSFNSRARGDTRQPFNANDRQG